MKVNLSLATLLVLISAAAGAELKPEQCDIQLRDVDRMLQADGLPATASDEQLKDSLWRNITSGYWNLKRPEDSRMIHDLLHFRSLKDINCKFEQTTRIGLMKSVIEKEPSSFSVPLKNYISHAFERTSEHCYQVLSANNWREFESYFEQFHMVEAANAVEKLVDAEFEHVDTMEITRFYGHLIDRVNSVAKESKLVAGDLFGALKMTKYIVRNTLYSLGSIVPVERLSERVRKFYWASRVVEKLERNLPNDLTEFISNKSADEFQLIDGVAARGGNSDKWAINLSGGVQTMATEKKIDKSELVEKLRAACAGQDEKSKLILDLVKLDCYRYFDYFAMMPEEALPWQLARMCTRVSVMF